MPSLRKQKKRRAAQRERRERWRLTPIGPERLKLLVEWARITLCERTTRRLSRMRREFNVSKEQWRGFAGVGLCTACGRHGDRVWHHIVQLQHGGTNSPNNLVKVCMPCHAVIHPFMQMTEEDPITASV